MKSKTACLKLPRVHELENHNVANLDTMISYKTVPPTAEPPQSVTIVIVPRLQPNVFQPKLNF
jgi:hypothetical protein